MPKASKKKQVKEADFKKTKTKLGKGKKVPSNATDTSFKARSIALPNQNPLDRALQAPSGEAISSSGLTLDEVLLRFRHPNGGVRREAIGSLKEILLQYPKREVGKVARVLGGAISDEDGGVRKALLGFFAWYLSNLDESALAPHLPLLLLQTSSALSHIFPEIRLDAARLVGLFLEHIPAHVTTSWPAADSTILEGLRLTVGLGGGGDKTQSGRLGASGKLIILRTILAFLRTALRNTAGTSTIPDLFTKVFGPGVEGNKDKGKGKQKEVNDDFGLTGQLESYLTGCGDWGVDMGSSAWEVGRVEPDSTISSNEAESAVVAQLYAQLHPLLLATFLEAAPTAFSPSSTSLTATDETSLELCAVSASLSELLARTALTSSDHSRVVRSNASDFLKRMAAWFPFSHPSTTAATVSATGVSPAFELSFTYSNLAILLAPRPEPLVYPRGKKEAGWKGRVRATEESWKAMRGANKGKRSGGADGWALEEVAEWITAVLSPTPDALAPPLTPQAYSSLLSLILPLLLLPPSSDIASRVGTTFLGHLARQGSSSQIRALGDQFLIHLVGAHEQRFTSNTIPFLFPPASPIRAPLRAWLDTLPKTLWELGTRNPQATSRILDFLLLLGLRGAASFQSEGEAGGGYSLVPPDIFPGVAGKLGPWFHLDHPSKGGMKGPWIRLERDVQKLGLDVAQVWASLDKDSRLGGAVSKAIEGQAWAVEYWSSRQR